MNAEGILSRLKNATPTARGWQACCPAHPDKSPSLSIRESDDRILIHCFAGCDNKIIVEVLGLEMKDLFLDADLPRSVRSTRKPPTDLTALSFAFRLASIDRMLHAEKILTAATGLDTSAWTDHDFDVAISAVERAHHSLDESDRLNDLADHFREKHLIQEAKPCGLKSPC